MNRTVEATLQAMGLAALITSVEASEGRSMKETERAIISFDSSDLTSAEADSFALLADRGIADIEGVVGASLPAWARRSGPIRYVIDGRIGMSRTRGRTVLLPLERVRSHSAPYLHETVHALVPSRGRATWLSEGLASYLESWVAENRGGYDSHVFTRAGDRGIHAAARRYLGNELGRSVLPWVGEAGEPPRLEEDRAGVARPFYVLSHSLTKFVVDKAGVDSLVRVLVSGEDFVTATGRSAEQWKDEWLIAIDAPTRTGA